MDSPCRFPSEWFQSPNVAWTRGLRRRHPFIRDRHGTPVCFFVECLTCAAWHWCLPALEIDGTAPTVLDVIADSLLAATAAHEPAPTYSIPVRRDRDVRLVLDRSVRER